MANKEILLVVDVVSNEKDIDKEVIFGALEAALETATAKHADNKITARVSIDRGDGGYETFRRWEVVEPNEDFPEEPEFPEKQVFLEQAKKTNPEIQLGDFIEEPIASIEYGRIGAQAAKQVIVQKVREAEREKVVEAYHDRIGELVAGIVKRVERGSVFIDLGGNVEALIPKEETIQREDFRAGDRVRGYLYEVRSEVRGPQLFVSRTTPEFLISLFKLEVPEVNEGLIEIISAARDPGIRAKIAVKSNDLRLDPIGACVGMRGSRVQAVSNELAGERVDIILWDGNEAQFVINAMAPAEIASIVVDEDSHSMNVAVEEESLSQAIGRGGQNVRLATELTGWELNVMGEAQAKEKTDSETVTLVQQFMDQLNVDEEVAAILAQEGFSSADELAYVPAKELLEIEEFDEQIVEELRDRAKDAMLINAIADEEKLDSTEPEQSLLEMDGMDKELAFVLANQGIRTMEDLADMSTDELMDVDEIDEKRAAELIMTARAPWFAEEKAGK